MPVRMAILIDETDRRVGRVAVPETTFVIRHADGFFVRTDKGIRLPGGGIGVVFQETEPMVRNRLDPA